MPDWPNPPVAFPKVGSLAVSSLIHSSAGWQAQCSNGPFNVSTAWGTASLGLYMCVYVGVPVKVYKLSVMNGATTGGNTDVGIYNEHGDRLASSTPTAQSGVSTIQTFDITDTTLMPGTHFLALANTTTTGTYLCTSTTAIRMRASYCFEQTGLSSGTLPATATFATFTRTFGPQIVAHYKSTV